MIVHSVQARRPEIRAIGILAQAVEDEIASQDVHLKMIDHLVEIALSQEMTKEMTKEMISREMINLELKDVGGQTDRVRHKVLMG